MPICYNLVMSETQREHERQKPPSKGDYKHTRQLLDEFCVVSRDIPAFALYGDLLRWRRDAIQEALEGMK